MFPGTKPIVDIVYGPPGSVDRHFSAAGSENLHQNDKSGAVPIDWELWHYPYIDGMGKDVNFKFVDICGCGEYRIPVYGDDLNRYAPK